MSPSVFNLSSTSTACEKDDEEMSCEARETVSKEHLHHTVQHQDGVIKGEMNVCGASSKSGVAEEHGPAKCGITESGNAVAQFSLSRSISPSPSLLHAPVSSWQLEQYPEEEHVHVNEEESKRSKDVPHDLNIPPSDSQLSLNCLQTIPQSCELPAVTSTSKRGQRKRRCSSEDPSTQNGMAIEDDLCSHSEESVEAVLPTTSGINTLTVTVNRSSDCVEEPQRVEPLPPVHHCNKLKLVRRVKQHSTNDTSRNETAQRNCSAQDKEEKGSHVRSEQLPKHNRGPEKVHVCPQCREWYSGDNEALRAQLGGRTACRHRYLQETDPRMWDISFPESEECDELLNRP